MSSQISENVNFTGTCGNAPSAHREKTGHSTTTTSRGCHNCGRRWPHTTAPCPARGKQCNSCGKPNHFAKYCCSAKPSSTSIGPTKHKHHTVHHVQPECLSRASDTDEYFFTMSSQDQKTPITCVQINNVTVHMVVDTGASIDIVDEPTFPLLQKSTQINLRLPKTHVFTYGAATNLTVLGTFNATLESKFKSAYSTVGSYGCLLSYKTTSSLGLATINIQAIEHRQLNHERLIETYGNTFNRIGQLKDLSVKLHIDPAVPPVAQSARKIPFHMRKQAADNLEAL